MQVFITRGKYKGKVGTIAGRLGALNRHTTKTVVTFPDRTYAVVRIAWLEAHEQLELPLWRPTYPQS